MNDKKYIVLECTNHSGLTVGNRVLPPGATFTNWPYSQECLDAAIENKRCKEVKPKDSKKEKDKLIKACQKDLLKAQNLFDNAKTDEKKEAALKMSDEAELKLKELTNES